MEIDDDTIDALRRIGRHEKALYDACAAIRSEIGSLIGETVPFEDHGRLHYGTVRAVRGHGNRYSFWLVNNKTGTEREIPVYNVLIGAQLAGLKGGSS